MFYIMLCEIYSSYSLDDWMLLKDYGHLLGSPGESLHALRMPGTQTAAFDFVLTLMVAWIFSAVTQIPLVLVTIFLLSFSVFMHYLFGVMTHDVKWLLTIASTVLKMIFEPNCKKSA